MLTVGLYVEPVSLEGILGLEGELSLNFLNLMMQVKAGDLELDVNDRYF